MCAEGADVAVINATVNTQPLMLRRALAVFRAWRAAGGAVPVVAAGHSLGEYTALAAADDCFCRCSEVGALACRGHAICRAGRPRRHGGILGWTMRLSLRLVTKRRKVMWCLL